MNKNRKFARLIGFLLMAIVMVASVAGPVSASPASEPSVQDKNGERRSYHPQTGMLSFLGADPAQPIQVRAAMLPGLTPDARADANVLSYGREFGIQDASQELAVNRQFTSSVDDGEVVRYQQMYQGVPILGGELLVNMASTGELLSMSGEISPNLSISVEPTFDAEQAREAALALVAKYHELDASTLSATDPELWIYDQRLLMPGNMPAQLVWRMDVVSSDAPIKQLVLINANNGKVSLTFNQIDTSWVGSGVSRSSSAPSTPIASEASVGALTLGTPVLETYDLGGTISLPGAPVCLNNSRECITGITDAELAHAYAYDTYMAYANDHGRDSIDGAGMAIRSHVRYGLGYQNAYWSGAEMVYGDGFSAADDVVGHELTHGVTQYESNLFYWYQSGAINESFSDVWGEYVDQTNGFGTDTAAVKWLMGEDVPGLGAIRNMKTPGSFGDPDSITSGNYYEGTGDNGGVHINSGVNNKAVYLMVDGGTFGGKTVTALGWTKTLAIYYYTQTNLLTSASDYLDLYNGLYQACVVKIGGAEGITSADCQEVRDATDAVKMNAQPATNFNPDALYCPTNTSAYPNLFEEDFETGTDGWTFDFAQGTAANWSLWTDSPWFSLLGNYATSGLDSLYADDDSGSFNNYTLNDSFAISPSINLPANVKPYLHFRHSYGFEFGGSALYDGSVLEYSKDGGPWTDAASLYSAGQNYKGTLNNVWGNPLGGRKAFANFSHGYVDSRYNLTTLAGHNVRFRWRMGTDVSTAAWGWWIDDVRVETCISIPSVPVLTSPANNALLTDYTPILDWKDSTPDLDHYQLQVDDNNDFLTPHLDITVGPSTWEILPGNILNSNTKYYWRVKAFNNGGGSGNWSAVRYFRTALLPPTLVSPVDAFVSSELRPSFDWTDVAGATGYTIQISKNNTFTQIAHTGNPVGSTYTPTADLPKNMTLYWRVLTKGANGPSAYTAYRSLSTPVSPPPIVTLLTPANNFLSTDYSPTFTWKAVVMPIGTTLQHYMVQVDDDPAFGSPAIDDTTGATDFTPLSDLASNTKFYWRVRAVNTLGEMGNWSASRYFRTIIPAPTLLSPADTSAMSTLKPTFDWADATGPGAITNYTIQISTSPTFGSLVTNATTVSSTYTPVSNLPAALLYWRVRANGANGPGTYSDHFELTLINPGGDDDGDGLPNGWEINGYDANGDTTIDVDLPALGADYRHKDIFVEMDYMANNCGGDHSAFGLAPNATVIDAIEDAFGNAPVSNPDGETGINIHLELDDLVPCDPDLNPSFTDFTAIKNAHFDPNRTAVYHYMIWADAYDGGSSSGFSFGIPGVDFIVTLGSWNNGGGTNDEKIGTFIHELGHNLDLTHGGSGHENYKPNYLSVMNYFFQTVGVYYNSSYHFDYQRLTLPNLNEASLNEAVGLNSASANADGYWTQHVCPSTSATPDDWWWSMVNAIDWNCDGDTTDVGGVNVNGPVYPSKTSLVSQNNWANIDFGGFGVIGSSLPPEELAVLSLSNPVIEFDELTLEMEQEFDRLRENMP